MLKKLFLNSFFLLLIFSFCACKKKKKEDTTSPTVSISSPSDGQSFHVFDTIHVIAHAADETQLTSVVVQLTDLNSIPVQGSYNVPLNGKSVDIDIHYLLYETHLATGNYYLSILASDGTNTHQGVKKIFVVESPTVKSGYYMTFASDHKTILRYDTGFAQQNSMHLNTGYNGMSYNGYYTQLCINGNTAQSVVAVDPTLGDQQKWTSPYSVNDSYTCIYGDGTKPYVGYYTGNVKAFSSTGGNSIIYINNNTNYYPVYFTTTSNYGVGIFKDKTGGGDRLINFTRSTGISLNNNYAPCNVVGIFEHTQDEFYIFGNDGNNQPVMYLYSTSANGFYGPFTLPGGKIIAAVQADSDFILYASSDGIIYGHRYSTNNTLNLTTQPVQKMKFNAKMSELYVSSNTSFFIYGLSTNYTLALERNRLMADTIADFEVITNK